MSVPLKLEVVTPEREVWSGEITQVVVRTTEGDIGILPGHAPVLATVVPCAAEIVTTDGRSEVIAIEEGFLSVSDGYVRVLTQGAVKALEITPEQAEREAAQLRQQRAAGELDDAQTHHLRVLEAQLRAAEKAGS